MSTYAIGDIHGNLGPLEDLLSQMTPELRPEDTLVFLGDYIDRGQDARGCVERIIQLRSEAKFSVITLLGNHEQWMLRSLDDPTRHSWLVGMEAMETIGSYSKEAAVKITNAMGDLGIRLFKERVALPYEAFFDAMPPEHLSFFQELKPFHRTPDLVCAHGGILLDGELDPTDIDSYVWGPLGFPEDYVGHDPVVYGHRDNGVRGEDGRVRPRIGANQTYGIDTISHGVLTAMRFPDGTVFQSARK